MSHNQTNTDAVRKTKTTTTEGSSILADPLKKSEPIPGRLGHRMAKRVLEFVASNTELMDFNNPKALKAAAELVLHTTEQYADELDSSVGIGHHMAITAGTLAKNIATISEGLNWLIQAEVRFGPDSKEVAALDALARDFVLSVPDIFRESLGSHWDRIFTEAAAAEANS